VAGGVGVMAGVGAESLGSMGLALAQLPPAVKKG